MKNLPVSGTKWTWIIYSPGSFKNRVSVELQVNLLTPDELEENIDPQNVFLISNYLWTLILLL